MHGSGTWRTLAGCVALATGLVLLSPEAGAQSVYAYPKGGQSQQQQQKDMAECRQWAQQQTGYNPYAPQQQVAGAPPPSAPPPKAGGGLLNLGGGGMFKGSGALGDTATGAALGAAGGAIAGDAGKGAAIGAIGGLVIGGIKRHSAEQERQEWERQRAQEQAYRQQQAQARQQQGLGELNKAYAACMQARNYQVQ